MTLNEVYTMLSSVNIPVYYDHVDNDTAELPYICYKELSTRTLASDNEVTAIVPTVQIELYTATRDLTKEHALEAAIKSTPWTKQLDFGDDENYYSCFYTIEILGG